MNQYLDILKKINNFKKLVLLKSRKIPNVSKRAEDKWGR